MYNTIYKISLQKPIRKDLSIVFAMRSHVTAIISIYNLWKFNEIIWHYFILFVPFVRAHSAHLHQFIYNECGQRIEYTEDTYEYVVIR